MLTYTQERLNAKAFEFIYGCALRDAILQRAFKGKKDWIARVTEAQEPVKKYVSDVLSGKFKDDGAKAAHEKAFLL